MTKKEKTTKENDIKITYKKGRYILNLSENALMAITEMISLEYPNEWESEDPEITKAGEKVYNALINL